MTAHIDHVVHATGNLIANRRRSSVHHHLKTALAQWWTPSLWTRAPRVPPASRAEGARDRGHRRGTGPQAYGPQMDPYGSIKLP